MLLLHFQPLKLRIYNDYRKLGYPRPAALQLANAFYLLYLHPEWTKGSSLNDVYND